MGVSSSKRVSLLEAFICRLEADRFPDAGEEKISCEETECPTIVSFIQFIHPSTDQLHQGPRSAPAGPATSQKHSAETQPFRSCTSIVCSICRTGSTGDVL